MKRYTPVVVYINEINNTLQIYSELRESGMNRWDIQIYSEFRENRWDLIDANLFVLDMCFPEFQKIDPKKIKFTLEYFKKSRPYISTDPSLVLDIDYCDLGISLKAPGMRVDYMTNYGFTLNIPIILSPRRGGDRVKYETRNKCLIEMGYPKSCWTSDFIDLHPELEWIFNSEEEL